VPGQMQGQSLLPFLQGHQTKWRTEFYYENLYENRLIPRTVAVRTEDFKYIRYIDHNYEELYELKNDPNEAANLSIDSKYERTLTSLQTKRDELARQVEGMQ
jgi:arylsulfatase A-like enzyme